MDEPDGRADDTIEATLTEVLAVVATVITLIAAGSNASDEVLGVGLLVAIVLWVLVVFQRLNRPKQ